MSDKTEIGRRGENLAAEFLSGKGFTVAARNFRYGKAEIDLIVKRENWLLFVEVKTRSSVAYGQPEEFLSDLQVNRIFDAAEEYIYRINWKGNIRFDVVSIKLGKEVLIEHFEDAIN
jgi:putative endonuclease